MSFQLIKCNASVDLISERLGEKAHLHEIFPVGEKNVGLSAPTKLLASGDEHEFLQRLQGLVTYDLYAGKWYGR